MPKSVAIYGNCQAQALSGLYRRHVAPLLDETVTYVLFGNADSEAVRNADVVVEQVFDAQPQVDRSVLKQGAKLYRFPLVLGTFLWPFASQPHVQNQSYPYLPDGPYPVEYGDSYLNRLIDRMPVEEAAEKYANLDMAATAHLDRLYEVNLDNQRKRDAASGINAADFIERHFRDQALFLTRGHPTKFLFDHVVTTLLGEMEIPQNIISVAINSYFHSAFPWDELPIHPSVATYYGLDFAKETTMYRHLEDGKFTFQQYVRRYLHYEWSMDLYRGLSLTNSGDPEEALALLDSGLRKSSGSARAWCAKAEIHLRQGDVTAAHNAAMRAIAAESQNPEGHATLGVVLTRQGHHAEAEAALRDAVERHPNGAKYHLHLADFLSSVQRNPEALEEARAAIPLSPTDARAQAVLGQILHRMSDLDGAADAYAEAVRLAPENAYFRAELASVQARQQQRDTMVTP